jgi:hypothetical protein
MNEDADSGREFSGEYPIHKSPVTNHRFLVYNKISDSKRGVWGR